VRRVLRVLSIALITAGIVILADVAVTLTWREPVSTVYGAIKQGQAEEQLEQLEGSFPPPGLVRELAGLEDPALARALAKRFEKRAQTGRAIGRVRIPRLDLDTVMVQGTDADTLQRGPGHYPDTDLPGERGTTGIAGHRTTYLAPFRDIDELERGDEIVVEMPYGTFTYEVEREKVVEPSDVQIVRNVGHDRAVLTACHPLYSAAQRYAIFARLRDLSLLPSVGRA
jgi:sortase A